MWLVRHGPTHARGMVGWSDLPADLSDRPALARLAALLPPAAAVVSSDLRRAVATADALQGHRPRLSHDAALREIHFGAWELRSHAEVEADDPAHIRAFWDSSGDVAAPGGESWNAMASRVHGALDRLALAHAGGDLVVVCHFGAILACVQRALGQSVQQAFAQRIDNLSLTEIAVTPEGWQASRINHIA
nr:histidine phosphatase family protein [Fertoeibacter niger]